MEEILNETRLKEVSEETNEVKEFVYKESGKILLKSQKETRVIPFKDILYVTRRDRKILIVTNYGEFEMYGAFKEFVKKLDDRFYKPLKYLAINLDKPVCFKEKSVMFDEDKSIYLGRDTFVKTKYAFLDYNEEKFVIY